MRKLDKHQREARGLISRRKGQAGLFMAPGTGKTAVAIATSQPINLVICRRDDFLTWKLQLKEDGFPRSMMYFIDSGKAKLYDSPHPWTFVTYDLTKNKRIFNWIKRTPFHAAYADESHLIKRWKARRTKTVIKCTRHIPRRIAMTGSAIGNNLLDVFSQCLFIDDGKTFGKKEWFFLQRYYVKDPLGHGWHVRRKSKEEVIRKLKTVAMYVDEDDVLKLPPKHTTIKGAPMLGAQRRLYEQVIKDWEVEIAKNQVVEINQVIVQISKLRQIASGFLYDEEGNANWFKSGKLQLLINLLNEDLAAKSKVVIWCAHTAEIEKIADSINNVVTFSGSNRKKKEAARLSFRDDPKVKYFVGQVDSGVGMNELIVADTSVYYSNSMKVNSKQQSMRRNRRRGSEIHNRIDYYELVTEGSIDEKLLKDVKRKMDFATEILDGIRVGKSLRQLVGFK